MILIVCCYVVAAVAMVVMFSLLMWWFVIFIVVIYFKTRKEIFIYSTVLYDSMIEPNYDNFYLKMLNI